MSHQRKLKGRSKRLDDMDRLYKAVQNFVESRGGKLVVIGGVEVQKWPTDNEFVFRIAVKCMGKQPPIQEVADVTAVA